MDGRIRQVYKWVELQLGYIVDALSAMSRLSLWLIYAVARGCNWVYVVNIEARGLATGVTRCLSVVEKDWERV
jgi:hypothetical protein